MLTRFVTAFTVKIKKTDQMFRAKVSVFLEDESYTKEIAIPKRYIFTPTTTVEKNIFRTLNLIG